MAPLHPTVVGDEGWRAGAESGLFRFHPVLDYYTQLPFFYPVCRINLNITSLQMKTGLNQRVFDAPACGAFLLIEARPQLEIHFEPGREVAAYQDKEEALDLARYYLDHEAARLEVIRQARRRVLDQHTYRHRLAEMTKLMKRDHDR